jgi:hypothetical protein
MGGGRRSLTYISFIYMCDLLRVAVADFENEDGDEKMFELPGSKDELALRRVSLQPWHHRGVGTTPAHGRHKRDAQAFEHHHHPQGHLRAAQATHPSSQSASYATVDPTSALAALLEENADLQIENRELRHEEHFLAVQTERALQEKNFLTEQTGRAWHEAMGATELKMAAKTKDETSHVGTHQTDNTHCYGHDGSNRVAVGAKDTLEECAKAAVVKPSCGTAFEYQADNKWCGCGKAGTANSDCREIVDANQDAKVYYFKSQVATTTSDQSGPAGDFNFGSTENREHLPRVQPEVFTQLESIAQGGSQENEHVSHGDASRLFAGTTRAAKRLQRLVERIGSNAMRIPRSALNSLRDSTRYENAVQEVKESAQGLDRGIAAVAKGVVRKHDATNTDIEEALRDAYEAGRKGAQAKLDDPYH